MTETERASGRLSDARSTLVGGLLSAPGLCPDDAGTSATSSYALTARFAHIMTLLTSDARELQYTFAWYDPRGSSDSAITAYTDPPPPLPISIAGNSLSPATAGDGVPHGPEKMAHAKCVLGSIGALIDSSTRYRLATPCSGMMLTDPYAAPRPGVAGPMTADAATCD